VVHDVFVSYSKPDKPIADAICGRLEQVGIRCWIAPRDVPAGDDYATSIIHAINNCKVMVVVFSTASNNSRHVRGEVERAFNKGVAILPFRIENQVPTDAMEYFLSSAHWLDALKPPVQAHISKLILAVDAIVSHPVPERGTQSAPFIPPAPVIDRKFAFGKRGYVAGGALLIVLVISAIALSRRGSASPDQSALAVRSESSDLNGGVAKTGTAAVAAKPPATTAEVPQKPHDLLVINSVGTGDYLNHGDSGEAMVRVVERDGNRGILRITRTATSETFRVAFRVDGTDIQITAVEQSQRPNGRPMFRVEKLESANVTRNGDSLDLSWTVIGSSPPAGQDHRRWSLEIKNVRLR
jgi:hypothetical protein